MWQLCDTFVTPEWQMWHLCDRCDSCVTQLWQLCDKCDTCDRCDTCVTAVWQMWHLCDRCNTYVTVLWDVCDTCLTDVTPSAVHVGNIIQGMRLASAQGRDIGMLDEDIDTAKKVWMSSWYDVMLLISYDAAKSVVAKVKHVIKSYLCWCLAVISHWTSRLS